MATPEEFLIKTDSIMAESGNAFSSLQAWSSVNNIQRAVADHLATIKTAYDKGVTILPGSDAGPSFIPYGKSYLDELLLLQSAGLPVSRILSSATVGPVTEGMKANLLVLNGLTIKKVFINGQCIR